ncbi:interferon regulatory factor 10 [Takifugu rubripes]|uniref:Interferon regulatory factor 10 n=1 Tax=Takifugu rubripes TaxID=31033 RepID=H2S332_TAKRU|nr:interferon regulatory factor 4-like [Takifugu rubripes]
METKMHMKEWLIAQIESGKYAGLSWENEEKTMFRIPWKHAAKKDYSQTADAALFKAWAVYKGKYREGRDKADPTMWKTRLRCALNKSTDFEEVPERNQLDITEPYKVYRVSSSGEPPRPAEPEAESRARKSPENPVAPVKQESTSSGEELKEINETLMKEHMYCGSSALTLPKQLPAPPTFFRAGLASSDFRLQVVLLYHGQQVLKVTTKSPDGCFILQGQVPLGNERIYGPCSAQLICFPSPAAVSLPSHLAEAMSRLLCHLERGVLLWMAPEGLFIKRFCQGRVYWSGPLARNTDQPNKLEREKTFKLFDVNTFFTELQSYLRGKGSKPSIEVELCFGEEFPDPKLPKNRKLIVAQVIPSFALELLQRFSLGGSADRSAVPPATDAGKLEEV